MAWPTQEEWAALLYLRSFRHPRIVGHIDHVVVYPARFDSDEPLPPTRGPLYQVLAAAYDGHTYLNVSCRQVDGPDDLRAPVILPTAFMGLPVVYRRCTLPTPSPEETR